MYGLNLTFLCKIEGFFTFHLDFLLIVVVQGNKLLTRFKVQTGYVTRGRYRFLYQRYL